VKIKSGIRKAYRVGGTKKVKYYEKFKETFQKTASDSYRRIGMQS